MAYSQGRLTFLANVVITAVNDESGALCGFGKITRDLTERKKAEENAIRFADEAVAHKALEEKTQLIRTQRERLQVTLASIGDGVIATDLGMFGTQASSGCCTMATPPSRFIVHSPDVPSSSAPESTMPITRRP
jgi:hypothetical protein